MLFHREADWTKGQKELQTTHHDKDGKGKEGTRINKKVAGIM